MKRGMVKVSAGLFVMVCMTLGLAGLARAADDASNYANEWGPRVGTSIPVLDAPDHTGERRTLADLAGDNGLLIFLNRSADW